MKKFKALRIFSLALCLILVVGAVSGSGVLTFVSAEDAAYYDAANKKDEILEPMDNNFLSRTQVTYNNINGKDVNVYTFFRKTNEIQNNPNFSQILLVKQCLDYKKAHPTEDVKITIGSFHFSVYLAACVDETKEDYGKLMNLYDVDHDEETGYYRLAYLLTEAAKMGVEVTVLAHLHADYVVVNEAGDIRHDILFENYYYPVLEEPAYPEYVGEGKTVGDFMTARKFDWTSYGDMAATDMMHLKLCTVSNYIDSDGVEHGGSMWVGSINIDGVDYLGRNDNNTDQSALLVSDHEEMYRVAYNFSRLIADYNHREGGTIFRDMASKITTEQIKLLSTGHGDEIDPDEQIVYIGTENDKVFELYFTPIGGEVNYWDTLNNPYCKYIEKLLPQISGEDYIEVIWNNVKYVQSFDLFDTYAEIFAYSFKENARLENRLRLHLPGMDEKVFDGLVEGVNIGKLWVNNKRINYHIKDLMLSYSENGERHWVTVYNSLNMHQGSTCYQANTILIINETEATGNDLYTDYAILSTPEMEFESRRVPAPNKK